MIALLAIISAPNKNIILKTILFVEESLDSGPEGGPNFAEILNKALPDSDHSSCDSQSDRSSNSGEVSFLDSWSVRRRRRGVEEVVMHYLYCYLPCPLKIRLMDDGMINTQTSLITESSNMYLQMGPG